MIRKIDDLGSEPVERPRAAGAVLLLVVVALGIVAASSWMRSHVEEVLATTEADWVPLETEWPTWIPVGFCGALAELDSVPRDIPLRSARWRDRIEVALLANPWIESVESIERVDGRILFRARFLRPVYAVEAEGGFLLVDSTGRVIDRQPGRELDPAWRIPVLRSSHIDLPLLGSGTRLAEPEFEECLALVRVLWESGTLVRHPGAIPVIRPFTRTDSPGLEWRLDGTVGVPLFWGRSPGSDEVAISSTEVKIRHLEDVIARGDEIAGAAGILLYGDRPRVVAPF